MDLMGVVQPAKKDARRDSTPRVLHSQADLLLGARASALLAAARAGVGDLRRPLLAHALPAERLVLLVVLDVAVLGHGSSPGAHARTRVPSAIAHARFFHKL